MFTNLKKIRKYFNKNLILIYQMGKVGSTSLESSLEKEEKSFFHIHAYFSPMTYEMFKKFRTIKYFYPLLKRCYFHMTGIIKLFLIKNNKNNVKIISIVREPISRNLSMFFQDIQYPAVELTIIKDNRFEDNTNLPALERLFYNKLNHTYGIDWFENEMKRSFGIDVYKYNFDKEKGFSIIKQGKVDLMLIKMEQMNNLEVEIGHFLNIKNFKLTTENTGEKKWYGSVYNKFRYNFKPKEDYINILYNTKFMRHFYTEDEIIQFKNKWLS